MSSLIALDYLLRANGHDPKGLASVSDKMFGSSGSFHTNPEIVKSSVGEHYYTQMKMLIDANARLESLFREFFKKVALENGVEPLTAVCCQKFLPLGLNSPIDFALSANRYAWHCSYNGDGFREIQTFYDESFDKDIVEYHKKQRDILERIGVSLCTGYTPKGADLVSRVSNDSDHFNESLLSYIIYPWVTQPFSQLKMLMSTLTPELQGNIRSAYFEGLPESAIPGVATSFVGNTFTFEILADYRTYLECLRIRGGLTMDAAIIVQRQAWTPWFGFDFPSALEGIDADTMGLLNDLIKKSSKLFIDILHTGLQWDSQYAVMAGYRGRFLVSGTLNGMMKLVEYLKKEDRPKLCNQVATRISEELGVILPHLEL